MSINEITTKVNELAANWEQFKALNDQRLKSLEKNHTADPVTLTQLETLNHLIDSYQEKISQLEATSFRPFCETNTSKGYEDPEYKKAFVILFPLYYFS